MIAYVKYIKKGLAAAGVAFVGTLGMATADGNLTGGEIVGSVSAGLLAFALTYGFTNGPKP